MIDSTVRAEISGTADPEIHEVQVAGIATSTVKNAIQRITCFVGRTSTHPSDTDTGVRVRHVMANPDGIPFMVKFKQLRMNPGDTLGLHSQASVEEDASSVHSVAFMIKDVWHELR